MAFEVKFYSFAKKLNSTKRPTGTALTYQCEIKTDCDIINPTIILSGTNNEVESNYNYCYIAIWNRYYFVTKYIFKDGLWYIRLSVDVLATWKTYIGNSTLYIERAATGGDGSIVDTLTLGKSYATLNNYNTYRLFTNENVSILGGTYVIGVKGPDPSGLLPSSTITYYALNQLAMDSLIRNLTDSTQTTYADITQEILKANLDPFQFLVDCKWYPLNLYSSTTAVTNIKLGWFTIPVSGSASTVGFNSSISVDDIAVPKHPQHATALGQYLNNSRYHSIYIYLPGFGLQKIESDSVITASSLKVTLTIDNFTGDGIYRIYANTSTAPLLIIPATIGVSYPLSATYAASKTGGGDIVTNFTNTAMQVLFPAATTKTLNADAYNNAQSNKALSELNKVGAVFNLMGNPATLSVNFSGNMGSRSFLYAFPFIVIYSIDTAVQLPDYTDVGYPVYRRNKISNYNGYVKVIDAHCEAPATDGELDEINAYLNGGFFYE